MTTAISVRRSAGSFAARHLGVGVDRQRHGLGDAGDVADEGDGGAELAERPGEGEHEAGEDAGERQRQGDRRQHADAAGAERRGGGAEARVDRLDRQADGAHHQRKAHDRGGQRRAGPVEGEDDAEASSAGSAPIGPLVPKASSSR